MGACLSCLGLGHSERTTEPETSRLLYEEPYRAQYGTTGHFAQRPNYHQPDPEIQRREREAMEGICHSMSEEIVDVFSLRPQENSAVGSRSQSQEQLHLGLDKDPRDFQAGKPEYEVYKKVKWTHPESLSVRLDRDRNEAAKAVMG